LVVIVKAQSWKSRFLSRAFCFQQLDSTHHHKFRRMTSLNLIRKDRGYAAQGRRPVGCPPPEKTCGHLFPEKVAHHQNQLWHLLHPRGRVGASSRSRLAARDVVVHVHVAIGGVILIKRALHDMAPFVLCLPSLLIQTKVGVRTRDCSVDIHDALDVVIHANLGRVRPCMHIGLDQKAVRRHLEDVI